jgi:hypothetical protein
MKLANTCTIDAYGIQTPRKMWTQNRSLDFRLQMPYNAPQGKSCAIAMDCDLDAASNSLALAESCLASD